eukprot:6870775-Alexandrium_andersonii.AAC.1
MNPGDLQGLEAYGSGEPSPGRPAIGDAKPSEPLLLRRRRRLLYYPTTPAAAHVRTAMAEATRQ